MNQKTTLQQWRILETVITHGGFAQAAKALHMSQSSISYAIGQLQDQLGIRLLQMRGRKSILTTNGMALLQEARGLLQGLRELEDRASFWAGGEETEVVLAASSIYPEKPLFDAIAEFRKAHSHVHVELHHVARLVPEEAFQKYKAHVCIAMHKPQQFMSDTLLDVGLVAVANAAHPLAQFRTKISRRHLVGHLMASVGEEEGAIPLLDNGLPGVERLNVRTISAAIAAVRSGACYGWLPEDRILDLLAAKELVPLRMYSGSTMRITLCLLKPETDPLGPTASHMAEIVQEHSRRYAESL